MCCLARQVSPTVLCQQLKNGQARKLEAGCWKVIDEHSQVVCPVLAESFLASRDLLVISHTIDRGSAGAAALAFGTGRCDLAWPAHIGCFHDMWNVVKAAMKMSHGGLIGKAVVRFMHVAKFG